MIIVFVADVWQDAIVLLRSDRIDGVRCRYLFWNDQGYHQIVRSRLDGSGRQIHVNNNTANRIYWPNQMSVDNGYIRNNCTSYLLVQQL